MQRARWPAERAAWRERRLHRWLGLLLVASGAAACSKPDDVRIGLKNLGSSADDRLGTVRVFVGAHKRWLPDLAAGDSLQVVLNPEGARPDVTLAFTAHGEEKTWSGPRLEAGAGYRMELGVDAEGRVAERHCRMPCSLP